MPSAPLHVALVGVGLVGSQLLKFLLAPKLSQNFHLVSLTNSKKTILLRSLTPQTRPQDLLDALSATDSPLVQESLPPSIDALKSKLKELLQLGNHVAVVDVTANQSVANYYPDLLASGIDVVTANKIGYSSSHELWTQIQATQLKTEYGIVGLESSVGAGLPIIQVLRELELTGDEVQKIEGVLSGTLSYIFSNFSSPAGGEQKKFSDIVKIAKEKGYTEPNPLSDLTGSDVARKLAILSRLAALPELKDGYLSVPTQSLVPNLHNLVDANEFMSALPTVDAALEELRSKAAKENKYLRYTGTIDPKTETVSCGVQAYDKNHPFVSGLKGSENMVVFTTERYPEDAQLVIKGPGAGAAVTAMGVLADLVRIWERRGGRGGI